MLENFFFINWKKDIFYFKNCYLIRREKILVYNFFLMWKREFFKTFFWFGREIFFNFNIFI